MLGISSAASFRARRHGDRFGWRDPIGLGACGKSRERLVEERHLAVGAPARVSLPRAREIGDPDVVQTPRAIAFTRELQGNGLIMNEVVFARQRDGLFILTDGRMVVMVDARELRGEDEVFVQEIRRRVLCPFLELAQMAADQQDIPLAREGVLVLRARGADQGVVVAMFRERWGMSHHLLEFSPGEVGHGQCRVVSLADVEHDGFIEPIIMQLQLRF
jgi:hypothetical protein